MCTGDKALGVFSEDVVNKFLQPPLNSRGLYLMMPYTRWQRFRPDIS